MPLLQNEPFKKVFSPAELQDTDKIFYCQQTGEIFTYYKDYFRSIMLLSSTLWGCALTGQRRLTYAQALESEKNARKLLKTFPAAAKGPCLLLATHAKHTTINEMNKYVYRHIKKQLFEGDEVDAFDPTINRMRPVTIVQIAMDGIATYDVISRDNLSPKRWTVTRQLLIRVQTSITRKKCKMFLRQHVEAGTDGLLRIKEESFEKFVHAKGLLNQMVFVGPVPYFKLSKEVQQTAEGKEATALVGDDAFIGGDDNDEDDEISDIGNSSKKDTLQQHQQQQCVLQDASSGAMINYKAEVLLRMKERIAESEKTELLRQHLALGLKKYDMVLDDQMLTDQRVMPPVRPVRSLIGTKHFGNFMFILEFLNVFADLLAIRSKFPDGLTMELLERALLLREVNGPLNDIFEVLLSVIFTQQKKQKKKLGKRYRKQEYSSRKGLNVSETRGARDVGVWMEKFCLGKRHKVHMNPTTVSEFLRMHLLSSEALLEAKVDANDLGIRPVPVSSQILHALKSISVYQLSCGEVIQLICYLIHQLLSCRAVRKQVERTGAPRFKFLANRTPQRGFAIKPDSIKHLDREDLKLAASAVDGDADLELQEHAVEQWFLGTDRLFRNYRLFQSLPGLFVEHDPTLAGSCEERATTNIPALASCDPELRRKFITRSIMTGGWDWNPTTASGSEMKVYDELLIRGIAEQERSENVVAFGCEGSKSSNPPTNKELLMCTAKPDDCPVHAPFRSDVVSWGYYATPQELDALIRSLNVRGVREKQLRYTLECERELIVAHMEKCAVEKLDVPEGIGRDALLEDIVARQQQMYEAPNLSTVPGTHPDTILELVFCERLLELEEKITVGQLGRLKVRNRNEWRQAIASRLNYLRMYELRQGRRERLQSEEQQQEQVGKGHAYSLHELSPLRSRVIKMARALIQIEQCIEQKFLRYPFSPHKGQIVLQKQYLGLQNLVEWELSLLDSTSFAQLFLHHNVLYDAIRWARSAEQIDCMICHRSGDPDLALFCHKCERSCHIFCYKPELNQVPLGYGFCMCRQPTNSKRNTAKKRENPSAGRRNNGKTKRRRE